MSMNRRRAMAIGLGAVAAGSVLPVGAASAMSGGGAPSDVALAESLGGGFISDYATVGGVRLHYVAGGSGAPLFLLPGWPQTWWEFRKIMPALARRYRVIAVDLRGMGGSDKQVDGYDKKTMAGDIAGLAACLGYDRINVAGHDIGSMVAFSFAVNHPDRTAKVALLDVLHPDEFLYEFRMVPAPGTYFHPWWFAFNQVRGLPEQLVTGRSRVLADWMFDHLAAHPDAIDDRARDVFAAAYAEPDAIRAGNGWYQTWPRDIEDGKGYGKVAAPMLGLASPPSYYRMADVLPTQGTDVRVSKVDDTGHFIPEEQPEVTISALTAHIG